MAENSAFIILIRVGSKSKFRPATRLLLRRGATLVSILWPCCKRLGASPRLVRPTQPCHGHRIASWRRRVGGCIDPCCEMVSDHWYHVTRRRFPISRFTVTRIDSHVRETSQREGANRS